MNKLSSSPVTWTWLENKWWPGYGECDVIIFLTYVWKHLGVNSHISLTQTPSWFGGLPISKQIWTTKHSAFSCSFYFSKLPTQDKEVNRSHSTLWFLTDTHYCCTPWKFSFPFPTVFSSHNKEFDYKFNISSNVLSHFGGTLNFSHREKSKPRFGFSFPCESFLPSTVLER